MIIKGDIHTNNGPVPIEKLKVGDKVVDQQHRARAVLSIEKKSADKLMAFTRNRAVLSADTVLMTVYGPRSAVALPGVKQLKSTAVQMAHPNARIAADEVNVTDAAAEGYVITVEDGKTVFVNNYCIKLEGE